MLARLFTEHDDRPVEDKIVLLRDITWADYQRHHLETRGDHSAPRFAYLEGVLEIMSPSLTHENLKSMIGRLVEVWCLEKGVEFRACYVFGEVSDPQQPDLAIEVVWTSGGLNTLEIYPQARGSRSLVLAPRPPDRARPEG